MHINDFTNNDYVPIVSTSTVSTKVYIKLML